MTLKDLEDNLGRLSLNSPKDRPPQPLVFLNACASSNLNPARFGSFPKFFLDHGFLGFIGTEISMPDCFAAAFSQRLYKRVLEASTLGEAIYSARWDMLKENMNPLGIFYSVYADPEIRVRIPVGLDREPTSQSPPLPDQLKPPTTFRPIPPGAGNEPRDHLRRAKAVRNRFLNFLRSHKP